MYTVYWLHLKNQTNQELEGYIGITNNLEERIRQHKKHKRKHPLTHAMRKYGKQNILVDILATDLSQEAALNLENKLRPKEKIGWNLLAGGQLGVTSEWYQSETNKKAHSKATSIATRLGIQLKDTREKRSARAKKAWDEGKYSTITVRGDKNPRATLTEQQVFKIKHEELATCTNYKALAKAYNVSPYVIWSIKSGRSWSHI